MDTDYFNTVSKDVLLLIALEYDLPSLLSFCRTSRKINKLVCDNNVFWYKKLINDFNLYKNEIPITKDYDVNNPKEVYRFIYGKSKYGLLIWSAKNGTRKLVEYSLNKGANIYINEALRWASKNGHLEVIKYLVEKGANIHALDDEALGLASGFGHLEVVKYLVGLGADIHAENDWTLRMASEGGHLEVVKYLVDLGADIHALDDLALMMAIENGHLEVVKYLKEQMEKQ